MKLSIIDKNILMYLKQNGYSNQRNLMLGSGYSLGSVNKSLTSLTENGFLDEDMKLTKTAKKFLNDNSPKNAVILAAGYGMRMVPINTETPKGLLTVDGQPLVERTIAHLNEVGITDISIVVGFMMEAYDYLVDKYNVKMIYNNDYARKNNLHLLMCDMNGENIFSFKTEGIVGVVVGNEGNGVCDQIANLCEKTVKIPMMSGIESLNAGVSGSIIMYEINKNKFIGE